jgi:hypothetical protein
MTRLVALVACPPVVFGNDCTSFVVLTKPNHCLSLHWWLATCATHPRSLIYVG